MTKTQQITIKDKKLKVYYVPTSLLRPAPYNPRKWSEEATAQLKESILRFG